MKEPIVLCISCPVRRYRYTEEIRDRCKCGKSVAWLYIVSILYMRESARCLLIEKKYSRLVENIATLISFPMTDLLCVLLLLLLWWFSHHGWKAIPARSPFFSLLFSLSNSHVDLRTDGCCLLLYVPTHNPATKIKSTRGGPVFGGRWLRIAPAARWSLTSVAGWGDFYQREFLVPDILTYIT